MYCNTTYLARELRPHALINNSDNSSIFPVIMARPAMIMIIAEI